MTTKKGPQHHRSEMAETPRDLIPLEHALLSAAAQKIKIRQDGIEREIAVGDAVVQKQVQSALAGSTHAQGQILRGIYRAERTRAKIIKADIDRGKLSKEWAQTRVEGAIKKGADPKLVTPHPDDYDFSQEKGWTLRGPWDQKQVDIILSNCQRRDLMVMQAALEQRLASAEEWKAAGDITEDLPGASGWVVAMWINMDLPHRFQLNDFQLDRLHISYRRLSKRELLKAVHLAWRRIGNPRPRGWKMPPLPIMMRRANAIAPIFREFAVDLSAGRRIEEHAFAKRIVEVFKDSENA